RPDGGAHDHGRLASLWRGDRAALRTRWPWIGALVACVVFAPHIAWNARHDWVPIRFQLHHGFDDTNQGGIALASRLPSAERPRAAERTLGLWFKPWSPQSDALRPSCKWSLGSRIAGYGMAVLLMCGAFLVPIVDLAARRLRGLPGVPGVIDPRVRPLLVAAALVPLGFFALVSLRSHVEANWPAVYVVGTTPLLAPFWARHLRLAAILTALNAALLLGLATYARAPLVARADDRVVREMEGYRELATLL